MPIGNAIWNTINGSNSNQVSYLLDDYTTTVGFSLRKLSSTAIKCVRVRRGSDNAESDFGFSGVNFDSASLSSWLSGSDGFVTKWYNQGSAGATYDAIQTTASNQPLIATSGTVETSNTGFATMKFDTPLSRYLQLSNALSIPQEFTEFFVFDRSNFTMSVSLSNYNSSTNFVYLWLNSNNQEYQISAGGGLTTTTSPATPDPYLRTTIRNSSDSVSLYREGIIHPSSPKTVAGTFTVNALGSWSGTEHKDSFQELVFFASDQSANRTAIETNINDYYSIF